MFFMFFFIRKSMFLSSMLRTKQQAVVRMHNKRYKPRPRVAHRGIARFVGIDQKMKSGRPVVTPHLP